MASHGAAAVISVLPLDGSQVRVAFVLECGCAVTLDLSDDRLIEVADSAGSPGERVGSDNDGPNVGLKPKDATRYHLVGKYRCPVGHPVGYRALPRDRA